MNELQIKNAFQQFLTCRAGFLCGVLSHRESNLARSCFASLCDERKMPDQQERSAGILEDLAETVEGRVAA